jgi:hypothetical protein
MANIFLAPRSNETSYKNFLSTIESGVDPSIVAPFLNEEGRRILGSQAKLYVWGNKESKKSSWDKMGTDDLVLFYKGREGNEQEGKILYAGKLLYKIHNKDLSLALWPPKPHEEPWSCVYFLKDLEPVYIPISEISVNAGYSKGFFVQGFQPLSEKGVNYIVERFGSFDQFVKHYSTEEKEEHNELEETGLLNEVTAHAEAEMLLLKIGQMLGYDTYSPDKSPEAYGEKLEKYITYKDIPTRFLGELVPLVKEIDVIWFKEEVPKFAFEVEHSTKFGSGFQRLQQLHALATRLFIVSGAKNKSLFDKFINIDPYYKNKANYYFRDYKNLEQFFNAVSEFMVINDYFLGQKIAKIE